MGRSPIHVRAPFRRVVDAIRRIGWASNSAWHHPAGRRRARAVLSPHRTTCAWSRSWSPSLNRGRPRGGGGIGIGPSRGGASRPTPPAIPVGSSQPEAGIPVGGYVANVGFHALSSLARLSSTMRRAFCVVERPVRRTKTGRVPSWSPRRPRGTRLASRRLASRSREDRARLVDDTRPGGTDAPSEALRKSIPRAVCVPGVVGERGQRVKGTTSTVTAGSAIGVGRRLLQQAACHARACRWGRRDQWP